MENLYFPQDLLADIFSRLPLRSLMRFKCLTQAWRLLFSNSKFIKYHLGDKNFFISPPSLYRLRIESCFEGEGCLEAVDVEYPSGDYEPAIIHCDGILCIFTGTRSFHPSSGTFVSKDMVIVWNPLTKEHKRLILSVKLNYHGIGFGYDSVIDEYKAVFIKGSGSRSIHSLRLKTGLLHAAINNVHYQFTLGSNSEAITVNNCLYWIAKKKKSQMPVILCFDLERDELREETSLCGNDYLMKWSELGFLEGFLCLASTFDNFHSDVWVMEENRVANTKTWIKLFRIPKIRYGDWFSIPVCPIAFTKGGQVLISECGNRGLCLFDLKRGSIKEVAIHGPFRVSLALKTQGFGVIPYVQSLVSLGV
ncbi:hypothetical protein SLA2020_334050 [Shorea laevis]